MKASLPLLCFLLFTSCVGPGLLTDGTSVAVGTHSRGVLRHGVTLPFSGDGYVVPKRWRERQRNYGTEGMVQLLVRAARRVQREHPGGTLGVADLSPVGGGSTAEHRSHHNGRDVDLLFYLTDLKGRPRVPNTMLYLNKQGLTVEPKEKEGAAPDEADPVAPAAEERKQLDVPRNWALVRALITDPKVPVQWIFTGRPIIRLLLAHAHKIKEPEALIKRAATLMHQPSDSLSHMDHYHVRIYCSLADRRLGCIDGGPPRWFKKDIKYIDEPPRKVEVPPALAKLKLSPVPLF